VWYRAVARRAASDGSGAPASSRPGGDAGRIGRRAGWRVVRISFPRGGRRQGAPCACDAARGADRGSSSLCLGEACTELATNYTGVILAAVY
jgi:hypothetical protein